MALRRLEQRVISKIRAVFDEHFKSADRAEPIHRRRQDREHERVLD